MTAIHELAPGDEFDGFTLQALESRRLYHDLYRVVHPDYDLPLILKAPRINITLPAAVLTAFETEMRILSRLRGVYTPKIIAKGDLETLPYLVMEYVEGDALQQAVHRAPVDIDELRQLMVPVCKAVHEMHRHNIIHLDLKPGNIRNRGDGRAVILDFGTAHHSQMPDLYEDPHKQAPRSYPYVAPEQLQGVRTDSRSDLFAIGVILYRLATAELPFGKGDPLTVKKRLFLLPKPPRLLNPEVPPWLQQIILTCLQRRAQDRYASAKQVAYYLSHPNAVPLTQLAELTRKPGLMAIMKSWFNTDNELQSQQNMQPRERIAGASHVLVAVDLEHTGQELRTAMQHTLRRLAQQDRNIYFTVMTVMDDAELDGREDFSDIIDQERPGHMHRLMELRHWMKALPIAKHRIHYQVLQGKAAREILDYAKYHVVDHILLCARSSSGLSRYLGSVSTKVMAEAPCTVTVVRTRLG